MANKFETKPTKTTGRFIPPESTAKVSWSLGYLPLSRVIRARRPCHAYPRGRSQRSTGRQLTVRKHERITASQKSSARLPAGLGKDGKLKRFPAFRGRRGGGENGLYLSRTRGPHGAAHGP